MSTEVKVPGLPESVADATVAKIYVSSGDTVSRDDKLMDLETDKVMLEVNSPQSGTISTIVVNEGDLVINDQVLMHLEAEADAPVKAESLANVAAASVSEPKTQQSPKQSLLSPSVRRVIQEHGIDVDHVQGTGRDGRITKKDVQAYLNGDTESEKTELEPAKKAETSKVATPAASVADSNVRPEKRVPMSRMRARIAERLHSATQETAMLTTFNEVDMSQVMNLRKQYKESFEKQHEVKLGFLSFMVKAIVQGLRKFPMLNASIDGNDIIYHGYFDIGVAVSSDRGLVVPVIRDADQLSMAGVESRIRSLAKKAREGKLAMDDITGGTFTITNGGTFGSMLSTPIINPPQSAVLGMHNIVERPVAVKGEVLVRPIMYLAVSYDHRLIDGKDAIQFLVEVKSCLEEPSRMLLDI